MKIILIFVLSVLLAGCAIGNTTNYHQGKSISPKNYNADSRLFVLVGDERPYVLSGDKTPSFVGLSRSLVGIPYPVHTASGKPLADDLSGLIARSIDESVGDIKHKSLTSGDSVKMAIDANTQAGWRTLLFTIKEWKVDVTGVGTGAFYYDVTLVVLDSDNNQLASKSAKGKGLVNSSHPLNAAIADLMGQLLNAANIILAVNGGSASPIQRGLIERTPSGRIVESKPVATTSSPEEKQNCTVDQILGMEKMGMTEAQMKAACN